MNLTLIAAAVSAALAGSIGFGAAWHWQAGNITEMKLEAANERITIQRAARANLERVTGQISQAQADAQRRLADSDRDRRGAVSELERLRDTSTTTVRAAADTPATCERITAAYNIVFTECSGTVQTLAADLDQCGIERQTVIDAWPR